MPTYGLFSDEEDENVDYFGDNDLYFKRWRQKSMIPVRQKLMERDHRTSIEMYQETALRREELRKKHEEEFRKKHEDIYKRFEQCQIKKHSSLKTVLGDIDPGKRKELKDWINKVAEEPSSTAVMTAPKTTTLKSRIKPKAETNLVKSIAAKQLFSSQASGSNLKSIDTEGLLSKQQQSTPNSDTSFSKSQESVFFPQAGSFSFNLDNYNGARPSFAFGSSVAQTSTPVSKNTQKFSVNSDIFEENETKYITAMESPITENKNYKEEKSVHESLKLYEPSIVKMYEKHMELYNALISNKKLFEKNSDEKRRSLLKRTITEKIVTATKRDISAKEKEEVTNFFKVMIRKDKVQGTLGSGSIIYDNDDVKTQYEYIKLQNDTEVKFVCFYIIDKYISLAELDENLTTTISDLISTLCRSFKIIETIFISIILERSILIKNDYTSISEYFKNVEQQPSSDQAIIIKKEKALALLFIKVFTKNSVFAKQKGLSLDADNLWKFSECILENSLVVPKSAILLAFIISIAKPRLRADENRWKSFSHKLNDFIPKLLSNGRTEDESINNHLAQISKLVLVK